MDKQTTTAAFTRAEVEDFLYQEAALLDNWQLPEWLNLLTDDIEYHIPTTDKPNSEGATTLSLVYDNRERVVSRVQQYLDGQVAAENPRSRVRRMISNVRILDQNAARAEITANFVCYRFALERMDTFVGRLEYSLVRDAGGMKIRKRRLVLDLESLRPHGMISIIL